MQSGWHLIADGLCPIASPTESDLERVHAEIRSHEIAISTIDEEIGKLMQSIRQLQFKKWEYNEKINRCRGLITLATRMPYEILAYIFELCVHDGYTRTPLIVSHVCAHWRRAASIPSVWSHVYVDFDGRDPLSRTKIWLARAQNSYIHVTLEIRQDQPNLAAVMHLLLEKRSQWRSLTIHSTLLANVNLVLGMCAGAFPEFRALHVSVQQEFEEINDHSPGDVENRDLVSLRSAFLGSPNFTTIGITRNILPFRNIIPPLISNLSLVLPGYHLSPNLPMARVLTILEGLTNLEKFSMVVPSGSMRPFEPEEDASRIVVLPRLRSIALTGWLDINTLLHHLSAPNLRVLRLRSSNDLSGISDEGTGQYLLEFLERAFPPLEELELRDIDIPAPYFLQCFPKLSKLKTLQLHDSEISDLILRELYGPYGMCPSLSVLDLRWCGHFRGHTLVELVRSRLQIRTSDVSMGSFAPPACVPISKVVVINCSFVRKSDIADLAAMTLCQVVVLDPDDHCRSVGCCVNDRYRRRLAMEGIGRNGRLLL